MLERELKVLFFYGIQGITETGNQFLEDILFNIIKEKLKIEITDKDVMHISLIGKKNSNKRPILIRLSNFAVKQKIWKNVKVLMNTGIFISEYFRTGKKTGKASLSQYNKLVMDKKTYTLEECRETFSSNRNNTRKGTVGNRNKNTGLEPS
ncbi:hypothetical protein HHI36_013131 [Cryptolaemus montrouzieri]|uniref:Uncharacterized protein n=1 Tax=Cryptolaemus montrouzieri TaxID=559131 RepID=A0ABD2NGW5_9CUCU